MLNWELRSWHEAAQSETPFFFDRGLPDIVGYLTLCNLPVPPHMKRATELFRYAHTVFIAPPWEDIYVQDTERKQSFGEAVQTYHAMAEAYGRCGYNLIRLPLCGPEERAEIIFPACTTCITTASHPEVVLVMAITIRKRDSILVAQVAAPVFDRIIGPVLIRMKAAPDRPAEQILFVQYLSVITQT